MSNREGRSHLGRRHNLRGITHNSVVVHEMTEETKFLLRAGTPKAFAVLHMFFPPSFLCTEWTEAPLGDLLGFTQPSSTNSACLFASSSSSVKLSSYMRTIVWSTSHFGGSPGGKCAGNKS